MNKYITLKKQNLDSLYVTNPNNIYYLTGFKGVSDTEREATVVIKGDEIHLILPKLYEKEGKVCANNRNLGLHILDGKSKFITVLEEVLPETGKVGFESQHLHYYEYQKLSEKLSVELVPTTDIVEDMRVIKTPEEIEHATTSARMTDEVFGYLESIDKIGLTERELAKRILDYIYDLGAEIAFDPHVATGENSAHAHHVPGNAKISEGILLVDLGVKYKGYCGDLTRTYYLGQKTKRFSQVYALVKQAQQSAIEAIKPGVTEEGLWNVCAEILGDEIKNMPHTLGHGVGLDIHENPRLYKGCTRELQPGMIITIEPGLYYPGWGGVRIEDYVLVTENGYEVL